MTEQPGFTYWECRECGFDSVTSDAIVNPKSEQCCPLCAGDNGRDVVMSGRAATTEDINVEGRDARRDQK